MSKLQQGHNNRPDAQRNILRSQRNQTGRGASLPKLQGNDRHINHHGNQGAVMGREQWGHGYHKGLETAKVNKSGLVGLYVHRLDENGTIINQMQIEKELPDNKFMLRYFSWADGYPNKLVMFTLEEMKNFVFYTSQEEWNEASDKQFQIEHEERIRNRRQ
jgi:hypothetical protein